MEAPQLWDAINEMNRQGVMIGSLLGGFTLTAAYQGFSQKRTNAIHRYSAIAAFIASVCFVSVVVISALVVFSFADYKFQNSNGNAAEDAHSFFLNLTVLNFIIGSVGTVSLFIMFGLLGWMRGVVLGIFTTVITFIFAFVLLFALSLVCSNVVTNYANLPMVSKFCKS